MKLNNQRKCVMSGKVMHKNEMIRVVKLKSGEILVNSNAQGRGCYISPNVAFDKVTQKRVLDRTFKTKVPNQTYDELKMILKGE